MAARFYVDGAGAWLGAFEGAAPPPGATEVPSAPVDARQAWQFPGWSAPPARSGEIAPLAFIARFTAAERAAIRAAAAGSAELADWLDRARFARVIDLAAAETVAGMNALVAAGLLSGARRKHILEVYITEAERP
jgi:hypothetical protein